ncbi:DivIVA protein [Mycobacterium numidiamassiliense]|uniref:Cell wall synthesis protein Wag31 n=1 Tax=Mycobacterium numidiamassiliense TaxID=1841861 RepID=A0A2U3P8V5_9MYCO|nr:DivIVA domain-containing protein [Mycobacterium numidiamassiliense]SPM40170.1 DivIVA protein [Mycobacterium numidiamassiliense]
MALTPADVHNVAFSRARVGKRGYSEQEVDLFIDLVEQELIRHIEEDAELRHRNAELRNRDGGLKKREAELARREAALHERELEVRKHEAETRKHQAQLSHQEAQLAHRSTPLPQQVAQIRHREAQVAQREAQIAQHQAQLAHQEAQLAQREVEIRQRQAELARWEGELREQEAEFEQQDAQLAERESELGQLETELQEQEIKLQELLDQPQAAEVDVAARQLARPYPQQLRAVPTPVAVNGASHLEETRVAAVHGRHDMERMAIRAVTDPLGNTVTETVHERTRRSAVENGGPVVAAEPADEIGQLKKENAELARSLGLIKSAAALLAAALDQQ